jgi:magnesium transporter
MTQDDLDRTDSEAALEEVRALLARGQVDDALARLAALHPADQAEVIAELETDERASLLPFIPHETIADIVPYLRGETRREVVAELDPGLLGPLLDEVEPDVAVDVLHGLPPPRAQATLATMRTAPTILPLLPHADESAGGRMTSDYIALHRSWTAEEALSYLRRTKPRAEQVFYLYVVDDEHRLEGVISLRQLVVAAPEERIGDLMTPEVVSVLADADQEEVAREIQHYNLIALPVVDAQRRLLGVVSVDDLIDVVEEEATEDMYRMVGLGTQETVFSPVRVAARRRIPWLLVNLATAFLAALTVSLFEDTIAKVAILAAFMPVIAGHAGNTGTQTVTLIVRGLALDEVSPADALLVASKEIRFGLIHGTIVGALVASLALALTQNGWLALVVFCAMLGNVVVAGVVGAVLPLLMRRLAIDPALASAIWLTTFTDVMGFVLLLGLGSLLVERLA